MFDEILGLPVHPLLVHAAVVLTPLLALLSVAYAVLPRFRGKLDWMVVLTAVGAPVAVFVAKESGESFERSLFEGRPSATVAAHESFATPLLISTAALGLVGLLLVFGARRWPKAVGTALSAASVVLAVVAGYYVVRAGHSGATAVWGG
ncbi:DUF2231 domain-containing protein [Microtetraspora sp. NBRC 16547]|uniref:DUF2231 domain-containing protein n=1 Tax=Microtetraspora sp. NBRC 16547 TaxID=3030993 RepID=UPI0024A51FAA|nr:DUF2231 domain-containing protein [Microtetraspora sp. NBRC 16547]GLX01956.1 hypothetical protein Misp02_60420 [Microtetraspora sp. NBRC 16547]